MKIGTIKKAEEIRKKGRDNYIWFACIKCGKERWVKYRKGKPISLRCRQCNKNGKGIKASCWKGGIIKRIDGYIFIWTDSKSPYASMRDLKGYILEHRLMMAKFLKRTLKNWEHVHHINDIKSDNRIENLMIVTNPQHQKLNNYLAKLWIKEHLDIAAEVSRDFVEKIKIII